MELLLLLPVLMAGAALMLPWEGDEDTEIAEEPEGDDALPDLLSSPLRLAVSDALGAEVEGHAEEGGTRVTVDGETALTYPGAAPGEVDRILAALAEDGAFEERG